MEHACAKQAIRRPTIVRSLPVNSSFVESARMINYEREAAEAGVEVDVSVLPLDQVPRRKNALQYGDLSSLGVRKADCP
jgi:hypothetical protein